MILIDTPWNTERALVGLKAAAVGGVIRHYNHGNSATLPEKRITPSEAAAISDAGLALCTIYQQRQSKVADFTAEKGEAAGTEALQQAQAIGQPVGSAIYLSVDADFRADSELERVGAFFAGFRKGLASGRRKSVFRVGAYGSGRVLRFLRDAALAEYLWLAFPPAWADRQKLLDSGDWHIHQHAVNKKIAGLSVDLNQVNGPDFGQFTVAAAGTAPAAMRRSRNVEPILVEDLAGEFRVRMRGGAELRAGPGSAYAVVGMLAAGEIVRGKEAVGDWMLVDAKGDGLVDGYCLRDLLIGV